MENEAKKFLELSEQESETVSGLALPEFRLGEATIYDHLALRGIRVDRVEPGLVVCTFKVPLRLLDRDGNFANGAIANLVDIVGSCVVYVSGAPMNVTMEMSISYLSTAKLDDRAGNFATGAIANLVDVVGNSTVYCLGRPMNVSIDMSISYMSKAKIDDELEITSKRLGQRGRYFGTIVVLKNKATGEIIAEGRHSLFRSNFVPKL